MKRKILLSFLFPLVISQLSAQGYPWERPLRMAWSSDGVNFNTPSIFQDSSGVPSVVKWKGDTLVAVFQWFRVPVGSPGWDRVAVKFSFDNGISWTAPTPILVNGFPSGYQRPFDPTLVVVNDSIRIYFSSSDGFPVGGLDSTVNTYSAISADGIHYDFEMNARVDEPLNRVIDPAVIHFKNTCHYISPIGSPQQGAYHYLSPDGLNFMKVPDVPSDINHNWTGNYMVKDTNELRFYGAGPGGIWYNSTPNGGVWNGYVNTNIKGGDPAVVKISTNNYLMIYVGQPYASGLHELEPDMNFEVYPNPATHAINLKTNSRHAGADYFIYDLAGRVISSGKLTGGNTVIEAGDLPSGIYMLSAGGNKSKLFRIVKK